MQPELFLVAVFVGDSPRFPLWLTSCFISPLAYSSHHGNKKIIATNSLQPCTEPGHESCSFLSEQLNDRTSSNPHLYFPSSAPVRKESCPVHQISDKASMVADTEREKRLMMVRLFALVLSSLTSNSLIAHSRHVQQPTPH